MPVIAVVNRKGGSGKSTLATHLAAYCASAGLPVMLGDVDRQRSAQKWLRLRESITEPRPAVIAGWAIDSMNVLRRPDGVTHVILDTPGGMRGFDLARVVMYADAIVLPICNSTFDRDSAAECVSELMALPRIASGRCKIAAIGMRLDSRTRGGDVLKAWANQRQLPFIGVLRETQAYVQCIERGLSLFDLPPAQVQVDMAQWAPILQWLRPILSATEQPAAEQANTDSAAAATPELSGLSKVQPTDLRPKSAPHPQPARRPVLEAGTRGRAVPPPVIRRVVPGMPNGTPASVASSSNKPQDSPATLNPALDAIPSFLQRNF